ncbi:hypothetical protein ACOME3_004943 [Neoechinorhynchus agilis]
MDFNDDVENEEEDSVHILSAIGCSDSGEDSSDSVSSDYLLKHHSFYFEQSVRRRRLSRLKRRIAAAEAENILINKGLKKFHGEQRDYKNIDTRIECNRKRILTIIKSCSSFSPKIEELLTNDYNAYRDFKSRVEFFKEIKKIEMYLMHAVKRTKRTSRLMYTRASLLKRLNDAKKLIDESELNVQTRLLLNRIEAKIDELENQRKNPKKMLNI